MIDMVVMPSGTVTFLFTDIEGSTARWEADPEQMRGKLALHNSILDAVMAEYGGAVFKKVGDAYCVAFPSPEQAATAAIQAQARLTASCPDLKVRMGLHTGSIDPTGNDYFGRPVNRVSRVMGIASGGQILASDATKSLLPTRFVLRDLGLQTLKDLMEPTRIWQLGDGEFKPLRGLTSVMNNLPLQTTSFVGRQSELADLQALLLKSRLVTLTGTGGTGKSRLSLQLVAENVDRFPDGVWFVELAALPDREDVLREVLATVGAPESGGSQIERLVALFAQRTSCLILDNCEHVLLIASDLAERLIKSCPQLTVLATSREPLGATGEAVYRVPSLTAPGLDRQLSLRELERFGACELFVERLATAAPTYGLQDDDALTIAKICTRLDGIPLALELAAARGRAMRLEQVEKRLDDRFRLLTGGNRNALSRQQTLQALIDWSVQLLDDRERTLFASLSVFAGGWRLEAAEAVCGCEALAIEAWEVLDLLTALVDKSLIIFEHASERYRMLESLRQYAGDMMARYDWGLEIRDRHADYFVELADPHLKNHMVLPPERLELFLGEYENIRAAFEWSRGDAVRAEKAAQVAAALWPGYMTLERSAELVRQLEPLLEAAAPVMEASVRSHLRFTLGVACARTSDDRALSLLEEVRGTLNSMEPMARTSAGSMLAYAYFRAGRSQDSVDVLTPFVDLKVGVEDQYFPYVFSILGLAYAALGDLEQAEAFSIRACDEMLLREDYRGWAAAKSNLGMIAVIRGRFRDAISRVVELNAALSKRKGNQRMRAVVLSVFGAVALDAGDPEIGGKLLGGGRGHVADDLDPDDPLDSLFADHVTLALETAIGPVRLREFMEAGRRYDWGPWLQAIVDLDPESVFVSGRFVVPFPELLTASGR
jgi:predicted ATPase/class 3 adenylate cyclase